MVSFVDINSHVRIYTTLMIARIQLYNYAGRAALKLLIRNRIRFVLIRITSRFIGFHLEQTILHVRIYLQSNTLDFRWRKFRSRKFRCEKQRTVYEKHKILFSVHILIIIYYLNNDNETIAAIQNNKL